MSSRKRRRGHDGILSRLARLVRPAVEEGRHAPSATAIAAEALRTGVLPAHSTRCEGPEEAILVGDPDDDSLANQYVGDETPGGSSPTPDQNGVDAIGRVYGLQEEDSGALRSSGEILDRRDRKRSELQPPTRPQR